MKTFIRSLAVLALMTAIATTALALSAEYVQFGQGPAQYLMTKEELAAWGKITTDADAKAFIDAFWARRDPRLKTEFDRRVKYADDNFRESKKRGAMTERGRIYITFGAPTRVIVSAERGDQPSPSSIPGTDRSEQSRKQQTWRYEADRAKRVFGVESAVDLVFSDRLATNEFIMQRAPIDLDAARQRVVDSLIVRQAAQSAPPAAAPVAAAPVATVSTEFKTPAFQTAVDEFKAGKSTLKKDALIGYAEFVSPTGEYYVPVQLFVPKDAGLGKDAADTFFAVVEDPSGKRVQVIEEPITLTATAKSDVFVDRTLSADLAAGKYTVIAGLAKAGTPLVVTSSPIELKPVAKSEVGVSRLLLLDNIYELNTPAPVKAPFAFGKLKLVPRPNLVFTNKDEIGYFVELFNPGIDPSTNMPKIQVRLDLVGGPKPITSPLDQVQVLPLSGALGAGQYAIVNTIPLAQLSKPLAKGDYTLKMKIVDVVSQKTYNVEQKFKIIG